MHPERPIINPPTVLDPVRLVVVRNPFDRRERDERLIAVPSAPTIEALIGEYLPAGTSDGTSHGTSHGTELVVSVNGQVVPRDAWASRTITAGDQMIAMPVLHGGGDGILGAVLSVALMVVAPGIGAAIASSMGLGAIATIGSFTLTWGTVIGVGVSMLGSALIGSLTAPDHPQLPSAAPLQSYDASPSYSWQPVTTQEPGGVVARAYGRVKLHGNIIAGYIQNTGDTGTKQVAHVLIDLGLGPYSALTDFKINDQALANYAGVTLVERRGELNQDVIAEFDDTRLSRQIGAKVVKDTPVTRATVGNEYDALEVVVTFPQGLYYANDSGGLSTHTVDYTIEVSANGGVTWYYAATRVNETTTLTSTGVWTLGRWATDRPDVWIERERGSAVRTDHTEGELQYNDYFGQYHQWHWVAGTITLRVNALVGWSTSAASQQPIRKTLRIDRLQRGITYQVRVTNTTTDQTSNRYGDDLYLAEINEILYDDFQYPRTVLVGIKALATDQLSGGIQFSCLADAAIVRVWNGTAWSAAFSRNPAWVCWDILTQPVFDNDHAVVRYDGLDPSRLDLSAFYAWAQWCDADVPGPAGMEPRCQFDGIFDTPTSAWEAALEVAASARATVLMRGTTVTVVWDRARTLPVQVFSVGNTLTDSFKETFLPMQDRAGAIEVEFMNAADDHVRDKIVVVNSGVVEAAAERVQFSNRGIRRASQAWREAMFRLKRNELLRRTAEIGVDIDALACEVGDMIYVQDDVARWGEGGRIVSGTTTTLVLDKEIALVGGTAYTVTLRMADDTIATRSITTPPGTVSSITVSSAFPATPAAHDVWAIATTDRTIKPFIVIDLRRDGDQRANLSLIEYNASLYGIDAGAATIPTADVSWRPDATVSGLTLREGMFRAADGAIVVYIDVHFSKSADARAGRVSVAGWADEDVIAGYRRLAGAVSGETYTVQVAPVDHLGRLAAPATWQTDSITVVGKLAPPADVPWASINGTVVSWGAVSDVDLAGYRMRWIPGTSTDWAQAQPLHEGLITESPWQLQITPSGAATLLIKSVDTSGNESLDPALIAINLGDPVVNNIITTIDLHGTGFPGEIAGATVSGGDLLADSTTSIWNPNDAVRFWSADAADDMWDLTYYTALTYLTTITASAGEAGAQMTIARTIDGDAWQLDYRRPAGDAALMWGDAGALMWSGDDAAPFRGNAPGYMPWPGAITAEAGDYEIRVRTAFGHTQGRIDALAVNFDVPDIIEYLNDIAIAAPGTRLPITQTYHAITGVHLTLQDDGGTALTARVMDKDETLGPLINTFDATNAATTGNVDAIIQGY